MRKQLWHRLAAAVAVCLLLFTGCSLRQTPAAALAPGESYVTEKGLYVGPLSAFWIPQDDNGKRYITETDAFLWLSRKGTAEGVHRIENVHWGWQEFPYTDESWNALFEQVPKEDLLFDDTPVKSLCSQYDTVRYQPLAEHCFLLEVDGVLWVVHLLPFGPEETPWRVQSIHTLAPEQSAVQTGGDWGMTE